MIFYHTTTVQKPSQVPRNPDTGCLEVSNLQRKELFDLLAMTSRLLSQIHITHFLCYKSLWSAIQESGPFPWDANAHLCALNSPALSYDEPSLLRTFRKVNLELEYSSAEATYVISNTSLPSGSPNVQITLFEEDPRVGVNMYRRVGWKRRLLPPNCDSHSSLQCFPGSLVSLPLPQRTFGPLTLPTPREDIDLLKYLYPDTWHKPPAC
ncbi:hypothetical protein FHG87_013303 [Trinorchestia longiramus]|nr:hypothetical protein FHG87_013303 [Trinorchestia longiramus]